MSKKRKKPLPYWQRRELYLKQRQLDYTAEYERQAGKRLRSLQNAVTLELHKYYQKYANNADITLYSAQKELDSIDTKSWSMTLEEFEAKAKKGGYDKELNSEYYKSQIARIKDIQQQLERLSQSTARTEQGKMASALSETYRDTLDHETYLHDMRKGSITVGYGGFNDKEVMYAVSKPWRGSDFSKRIWKNYTEVLPDKLTDTIGRGLLLGKGYDEVTDDLARTFKDVRRSDIHRLVVTEMAHAQEQATAEFYRETETEYYTYLATLETHTCDVCRQLDGKKFKVSDIKPGINYPLMHPYCRCTTVPADDDFTPDTRWARDPETGKGELIQNMTFTEWQKLQYAMRPPKVKEAVKIAVPLIALNEVLKNKIDLDEYTELKEQLGENDPLSLGEFVEMKYNKDSKKYHDTKDKAIWIHAEFANKEVFENHYNKHSKEFDIKPTKEEYLKIGIDLLSSGTSDSILGYQTKAGRRVRYDVKNNVIVIGHLFSKDKIRISTILKPKKGLEYYYENYRRDNKDK